MTEEFKREVWKTYEFYANELENASEFELWQYVLNDLSLNENSCITADFIEQLKKELERKY